MYLYVKKKKMLNLLNEHNEVNIEYYIAIIIGLSIISFSITK